MADEQQSSKLTESMVREIEELCDDSMFNEREGTRNQTMPGIFITLAIKNKTEIAGSNLYFIFVYRRSS